MIRRTLAIAFLAALLGAAPVLAQVPVPPGPASPPTPTPLPTPTPPPPPTPTPGAALTAGPSPTGAVTLTTFTAQLLDLRDGFVYFTTGDAFRLAPNVAYVDDATGQRYVGTPHVGLFGRATLDTTGTVTRLALTTNRLQLDRQYADIRRFAVAQSTVAPAPEIRGPGLTGRPVNVQFLVRVPPQTPITDAIYITTDASGWNPSAIRMDRVDGEHYRVTRPFASGTKFAYRYTRGSWNSMERGEDGLETSPRAFTVREVDVLVQRDTVWRWADKLNPGSSPQVGPDSIPTPFNPNPFGGVTIPGRGAGTPGPRLPGPATPPPPNTPR